MQPLAELVSTLELQNTQKADYVMPAKKLRMNEAGILEADGTKAKIYTPNEVFHTGASFMLNIPNGYYNRMREQAPALLADSVNTWLDLRKETSGIMLRTFESPDSMIARALLSDRYNILDNYDVLFAALQAIKDSGLQVEIQKATVTDKKLYLAVVAPQVEIDGREFLKTYMRESNIGDGIISGFIITNSEVGLGSFEIRPRAMVLKCKNGLISADDNFRKVHLGVQLGEGQIQWSEGTKQKNFELVISQTQDAIKTFLSKDYLGSMVERIYAASKQVLTNPVDTVQNVCKELMVTEERKRDVMNHFLAGGDHSAAGVFQALTRAAQDMPADDQFDLEARAFDIIPRIIGFDKPFSKN